MIFIYALKYNGIFLNLVIKYNLINIERDFKWLVKEQTSENFTEEQE